MTNKEKAKEYDKIVEHLWLMALNGNLLQSTLAAALIMKLKIKGPNGEDPEEA